MIKLNNALIEKINESKINSLYGEDYLDIDHNTSITLSRIECSDSPKYISIYGVLTYSDKIDNRSFVREIITCNEDVKLGTIAHYYDSSEENREAVNELIKGGYKSIVSDIIWSLCGILEMGEERIRNIIKSST